MDTPITLLTLPSPLLDRLRESAQTFARDEYIFTHGVDPRMAILLDGECSVQVPLAEATKIIGNISAGQIIGEGILMGRTTKQVDIMVSSPSATVAYLTIEDIDRLRIESPMDVMDIYHHIITLTNARLIETNRELAILYEMSEKIHVQSPQGLAGFFECVRTLHATLGVRSIFYAERHPIVENFYSYRFDSRFPSVRVNERATSAIHDHISGWITARKSEIRGTPENVPLYAIPLRDGTALRGYLILGGANGPIDERTIRIVQHLAPALTGMLPQG